MGFDLFMTVAAIVAAAVATWAILRLFLSENDGIAPSCQRITDEKPAENHTENPDEEAGETHRSDIAKRLAISTILIIPTFTVTMLTFGGITLPHWLTNPWLHAIIATPVMFYCAAPAGVRGVMDYPRRVTQSIFRFRKHGRRAVTCDFADRATSHGEESIGRRYSDRAIARNTRNTRNTAKHGYAYPGQHHI